MLDTRDDSYDFTFDELVTPIESNTDGLSSGEVCSSECLIHYEHLRRILPIAIIEQTSLLQLHSSRLKERRRHYPIIGNSFISLCDFRITSDPKRLPHCAATEWQVRYRSNRSHPRQRPQRLQCVSKKLRSF